MDGAGQVLRCTIAMTIVADLSASDALSGDEGSATADRRGGGSPTHWRPASALRAERS